MRFCHELLEKEGVALVPGKAFGLEGYVRLSLDAQKNRLKRGWNASLALSNQKDKRILLKGGFYIVVSGIAWYNG